MPKTTHITCGRFDNNIFFHDIEAFNERVRIGSKNPNKLNRTVYTPIATDGKTIIYEEKLFNARDFFTQIDRDTANKLIVLTIKERELILDILFDFDIDVKIFEVNYPIFNHIKYISNINYNYMELKKLLSKVYALHIKGKSLAHNVSTNYLYKIERKLRFKTKYDYFFAFAYKGGYQEVFKFKEEREDRHIIAMDFNSMYIDAMMGDFLQPKSIYYKSFKNIDVNLNNLEPGLYRVVLKNAKESFFQTFHPFKYSRLNKQYYFKLNEAHHLELLLFKNEIEYYKNFFNTLMIIEGFVAKKTIKHPLKKYAIKLYNERLLHRQNNNHTMENLSKFKLTAIHSSTNQKRFQTLKFQTKEELCKYLETTFMFNFSGSRSIDEQLEILEDSKFFTITKDIDNYILKTINFDTNETLFSISSQIISNSRIKMIKTIESFLLYPSVEICYCNVDSIHISILKSEVNSFLKKYDGLISNKLGNLKIESISEKGYWFDVGRYWLKTNDKIDLFKNVFFNHRNDINTFLKTRKIKFNCTNKTFHYIKERYASVYNAFSYTKKLDDTCPLDTINYKRYNFEEIEKFHVASRSISQEILNSKQTKIVLFDKLATVQGHTVL